jgi:hypothetical protein
MLRKGAARKLKKGLADISIDTTLPRCYRRAVRHDATVSFAAHMKENADEAGHAPSPLTTPHGDTPPSADPLFGQTPTPHARLTPPRREGHLLLTLSALPPVVITRSVSALVSLCPSGHAMV